MPPSSADKVYTAAPRKSESETFKIGIKKAAIPLEGTVPVSLRSLRSLRVFCLGQTPCCLSSDHYLALGAASPGPLPASVTCGAIKNKL